MLPTTFETGSEGSTVIGLILISETGRPLSDSKMDVTPAEVQMQSASDFVCDMNLSLHTSSAFAEQMREKAAEKESAVRLLERASCRLEGPLQRATWLLARVEVSIRFLSRRVHTRP